MRTTALVPEVVVMGAALALLAAGRLLPARRRLWIHLLALVAAVAALALELWLGAAVGTLFAGGWGQDRFALFAKAALLLGLIVLVAGSLEANASGESGEDAGSLPLAFLVVFGGMVAASATSLVGLWVGLELAALAAVGAVGLSSREAGTRLLLLSGVAAALVAAGFAILYAMAGSASLAGLAAALRPGSLSVPLALAVLLTLAGIVVRLALAPVLLITTDAGRPVSAVGAGALGALLLGVAAVVIAKVLSGLDAVNVAWAPWLAVLAATAMILGGLRAVTTRSPRALAAWLVVTQAGWIAAGFATHDRRGSAAALLVLAALLLAAAAAPALAVGGEREPDLATLRQTEPVRAFGLVVLLLSLAGAPPLAGFVGEFAVAAELVRSSSAWLLAVGLLGSLLALVAVVRVLRLTYLGNPVEERRGARVRRAPRSWSPVSLAPAVLVLLFVVLANPISGLAMQGAEALRLP
ncbi:MAG TPA: proton-conducting transporter membrane subunit [Candidatus Dormibacteraeota bacterium]|nr:proton-conducting transporter membrane subunit [Candidatus Dormibacteraeota bacterium]